MSLLTVGHSTHPIEEFCRIAWAVRLEVLVDVRSHRTSKWPWWHEAAIRDWTAEHGIEYQVRPELGGWDVRHTEDPGLEWAHERGVRLEAYARGYFPKQRIGVDKSGRARPEFESRWTNQGLHDYAWFTATSEFLDGVARLRADFEGPDAPRAAIFCSEFLWWKCHRSMIADVVVAQGGTVLHMTPRANDVRVEPHQLRDRLDRYPRPVVEAWRSA